MTFDALTLLRLQAAKHADSVKRLTGQLAGVERALEIEKAKLSAVEEAIAGLHDLGSSEVAEGPVLP